MNQNAIGRRNFKLKIIVIKLPAEYRVVVTNMWGFTVKVDDVELLIITTRASWATHFRSLLNGVHLFYSFMQCHMTERNSAVTTTFLSKKLSCITADECRLLQRDHENINNSSQATVSRVQMAGPHMIFFNLNKCRPLRKKHIHLEHASAYARSTLKNIHLSLSQIWAVVASKRLLNCVECERSVYWIVYLQYEEWRTFF